MKKFFITALLLCSLLVPWMGEVKVAKAEDVEAKYTNINDCLIELGYPTIELRDGYKYIFSRSGTYSSGVYWYHINCFKVNENFDAATDTEVWYQSSDYGERFQVNNLEAVYHYELQQETLEWMEYTNVSQEYFMESSNGWPKIYYSDIDLYYRSDCGNGIFFQQTPLLQPKILGMKAETLTQIMEQTNPLQEILLMIPTVMVCLVGYVGLRKGLAQLARWLKMA